MDSSTAPPQPQPPPPPTSSYPDSLDSSPRSRAAADAWDEQTQQQSLPPIPNNNNNKLRLMCSYDGHIVPRPHDKTLCYVGGDTRMIVIDRHVSLSELISRLAKTLLHTSTGPSSFTIKYQLPNEDLDSLISVTTDEDLDNMIDEYDRVSSGPRPARIRLFLFPNKPESGSSIGSLLDSSTKSEDWFLNALNGTNGVLTRNYSDSTTSSVNCLLGLDGSDVNNSNIKVGSNHNDSGKNTNTKTHDVHSVPDSPIMLETTSSFGSTNSTPSLANLPPIRVHVAEEQKGGGVLGIEEQLLQMNVGGKDEGFMMSSAPLERVIPVPVPVPVPGSIIATTGLPVHVGSGGAEDERSDQGALAGGYRKLPIQPFPPPPTTQPKPSGVLDLPSPDSVSSEGSLSNRGKPVLYQDPAVQIPAANSRVFANPNAEPKFNVSDPNARVQMQPVQESPGYILQSQLDQLQPQQFVHAGAHYIQHHPSNQMPISSYYPLYPSQQHSHHQLSQLEHHQYPVYLVPARQPQQAYSLPVQQQPQQPSYTEAAPNAVTSSRPQTPPTPNMMSNPATSYTNPSRNAPPQKTELAAGMYRTAASGAQPMVQVASNQQYMGYSQVHHPSQSMAPNSVHAGNFAYEYADPAHAQIYYTQPLAPTMPAQYQTMQSTPMVMLSEAPPTQQPNDNVKQQVRTTQAP